MLGYSNTGYLSHTSNTCAKYINSRLVGSFFKTIGGHYHRRLSEWILSRQIRIRHKEMTNTLDTIYVRFHLYWPRLICGQGLIDWLTLWALGWSQLWQGIELTWIDRKGSSGADQGFHQLSITVYHWGVEEDSYDLCLVIWMAIRVHPDAQLYIRPDHIDDNWCP